MPLSRSWTESFEDLTFDEFFSLYGQADCARDMRIEDIESGVALYRCCHCVDFFIRPGILPLQALHITRLLCLSPCFDKLLFKA